MEILGFDEVQLLGVVVTLLFTYVTARIFPRTLAWIFERTPFPEKIERAIVRVSKYIIYVMGLFIVISILGVDLTPIIIGMGAFAIAISFAMSNIIQNFVSGIIVQGDKPFVKGDWIKMGAHEGRVCRVGIRTTLIETKNGDMIYIPNSFFISNPVVNVKQESKLQAKKS